MVLFEVDQSFSNGFFSGARVQVGIREGGSETNTTEYSSTERTTSLIEGPTDFRFSIEFFVCGGGGRVTDLGGSFARGLVFFCAIVRVDGVRVAAPLLNQTGPTCVNVNAASGRELRFGEAGSIEVELRLVRVANNDDPALRESEGVNRGVRHIGIKNLSDEPLFTHTFKYKQRSELVRDGIIPARVPNQKRANRYSTMLDSVLPPPLPNTFFHTRYHDLDAPIASNPKPAPRPHSNYTPRPPSTPAPRLSSSFTISPIVWDLKATPLPNGSLAETPKINATIAPKRRASSSSPIDWHIPPKKRLISDSPAIAISAEPSLPMLPSFSSFVNSTVKLEDEKNPFMTSNSSSQITQNVVQEAGAVAVHGHKRQTHGHDGPEQEGPSNQQSKKAKSDVEISRLE